MRTPTRRTRLTLTLVVGIAVALLAAGCSTSEPEPAKDSSKSSVASPLKACPWAKRNANATCRSAWGSFADLQNAGFAVERDLKKFQTASKKYPTTAKLDVKANTLNLDVPNETSDQVEDYKTYKGDLKLGWYRNYADPRLGKVEKPGLGSFSYCISNAAGYLTTSGTPVGSSSEAGDGACPAAPVKG